MLTVLDVNTLELCEVYVLAEFRSVLDLLLQWEHASTIVVFCAVPLRWGYQRISLALATDVAVVVIRVKVLRVAAVSEQAADVVFVYITLVM